MSSLSALFASLALLLPGVGAAAPDEGNSSLMTHRQGERQSIRKGHSPWLMQDPLGQIAISRQIRIERRVVVRISPRAPVVRQDRTVDQRQAQQLATLTERRVGKCVSVSAIAGAQPTRDNKLMLFLRDRRIIRVNLEKACHARDFYSGFYVEQNKDGLLCVNRDKLHSRTGANCKVSKMRQLVSQ